jgi:hypothetical protein
MARPKYSGPVGATGKTGHIEIFSSSRMRFSMRHLADAAPAQRGPVGRSNILAPQLTNKEKTPLIPPKN